MERKYVPVRVFGNPMQVSERIRQVLQAEKLTRSIPAIKFEKGARGEFFVFLTVQGTETKNFLNQVQTAFARWNLKGNMIPEFLSYDQIKSMISRTEIETHSLNALIYKSLWTNNTGDSFDLSEVSFNTKNTDDTLLGERFDKLLYWLSANAEGTWQTFVQVCSVLQLVDDVKSARSIFRRLILLGYLESSEDGQKWSICPTTLVKCAANQEVYFLTGQQTPKLLNQLKEKSQLENIPQPDYQGPSCVKVRGVFPEEFSVNGSRIVFAGAASVWLAQLLPDLAGWKNVLPVIDRLTTTTYNIEIWDGTQFIQDDLFYERHGRYFGESGMYRLTKKEENNLYRIVLYFDEPNQQWLRGDWYGLRFLAYNAAGRYFEVKYDSSANEILIPIEERWPMLYERAMVLASGMLPSQSKDFRWLKYSNVSNELVQLLADKLNISIMEI